MNNTVLKVVASVSVFIIISIIIAYMRNAHIFGKTLLIFIMLFILKLIWSNSHNKKAANRPHNIVSKPTQVDNTHTPMNNSQQDFYNGGHNAEGGNTSNQHAAQTQQTQNSVKKNREFDGSNPYTKN